MTNSEVKTKISQRKAVLKRIEVYSELTKCFLYQHLWLDWVTSSHDHVINERKKKEK